MLIVFFGCNNLQQKTESDITVRQWFYEDGTLMKEMEYTNGSIPHGTYRFFYPSGVLQDSAQIAYNKFHGKRFEYYENGNPYIISIYVNGKERSGVNYRKDGSLNEYITANYATELVFIIRYDSLGKIKNYEGYPIFSWVQEETYPIGENFSVELLVANPPNCKTEVLISDWDNAQKTSSNIQIFIPDEFNRVVYKRRQNPRQELYILHVANIYDTVSQTTLNDTLIIIIAKDGKSTYARNLF